jgi:hypothetical protein
VMDRFQPQKTHVHLRGKTGAGETACLLALALLCGQSDLFRPILGRRV